MSRPEAHQETVGREDLTIACGSEWETPFGPIWVAASTSGLAAVQLGGEEAKFRRIIGDVRDGHSGMPEGLAQQALEQIGEYLAGNRHDFDLPLDLTDLTTFQRDVLDIVRRIPYGQLRTYGSIADEIGRAGAARAVGRANATNPSPLVIPCHRVVGSDGRLHGYGGGGSIATKAWLLRLEGSYLL